MYIAWLRYIQSRHEADERRNPDTAVRRFLPLRDRVAATWMSSRELARLRADPFYYYLLARTKHYDEVVQGAIASNVPTIFTIGSGADTRPYRFQGQLRSRGVRFVDCDQPEAISAKERWTRGWRRGEEVIHVPIDLHATDWSMFISALEARPREASLVFLEGVTPYVNHDDIIRLLKLLVTQLGPASEIAYDFKIRGIDDSFGRGEHAPVPFRLPAEAHAVRDFHASLNLELTSFELSEDLCARLVPRWTASGARPFVGDGLVRVRTTA